jgi:tight adherence protein B
VTLSGATLIGAIAGALLGPALVKAAEGAASALSSELEPIMRRAGGAVDRVLRPLRLAGAHGIVPTERERLRFSIGAGAGGFVLGFAISGPLASIGLAVAAGWLGSRAFVWRRERYRRSLDAGAANAALALADALDAGQSVRGALAEASRGLTGPIAGELLRLRHELELGAETEDALERLRDRAGSRRINLIVAAVRIQRRAGGSLATLLRDIATTIEEHDRLEDEARAASAQARFTSVVVVSLPVFGVALAELAAPGILSRMIASPIGTWLLGAALTFQAVGLLLIRRLSRVDT